MDAALEAPSTTKAQQLTTARRLRPSCARRQGPRQIKGSAAASTPAALFLDRDGTIIYDKNYLADPAGVELIPGARDALRDALRKGYRLFLFTNQSGIGRGYYTLDQVHDCNARMLELLGLGPNVFSEICIAPEAHSPPDGEDDGQCYRKPSPRFIREMITSHALAPAQCWMVGDRESDIEAGLRAGISAAAVCTGKYNETEWQRVVDSIFRTRWPNAQTELQKVTVHADLLRFVESLPACAK